jgi:D-alanyl-lipoteichoic acid acyltransferase DltB (MBOAT superfamily)
MLDYDSFDYFGDLLAMSIIVVPLFFALRWTRGRRVLLTLVGMYLLFLIAPRLLALYVPFWLVVFALQHFVAALPERRWRPVGLTAAIVVILVPMVLWKLAPTWSVVQFNLRLDRLVDDVSPWLGAIDRVRDIILPIGVSFATFRAIDLVVKVSVGITDPLSASRLLAFGFFPPVQVIGPVIEYTEIERGLDQPIPAAANDVLSGVLQVAVGMVKVFVIAYALEPSTKLFTAFDDVSWWETWVELFLFALYFFFNFAGFSDIAIGLARIYGFRLLPNFNNPYMRTNPQEFWNNWHMSLTRFARRNVFVPLGGMRRQHQYRAIFATIMVIALWHDISIPLVLFGLYHAAGLIGHRMLVQRRPPAAGNVLLSATKMAMVFVFVVLSFPLLLLRLGDVRDFYAHLFGFQ